MTTKAHAKPSKTAAAQASTAPVAGARVSTVAGALAGPPAQAPAAGRASGAAGGDKREHIVEAALELFVRRGFYGTTVPEIAERAEVGAGTIYRYFDSKEALVNVIYREQKMLFAKAVLDDFPANAPTREQFRVLWTRIASFACEQTTSFCFLELHHHAPYLDEMSQAVEQRMLDLIYLVIMRAQERRELKQGPARLLVGIVMGAFVGVVRTQLEEGLPLDHADWVLGEQCAWEAIRS